MTDDKSTTSLAKVLFDYVNNDIKNSWYPAAIGVASVRKNFHSNELKTDHENIAHRVLDAGFDCAIDAGSIVAIALGTVDTIADLFVNQYTPNTIANIGFTTATITALTWLRAMYYAGTFTLPKMNPRPTLSNPPPTVTINTYQ